jgi:hypothetical protein
VVTTSRVRAAGTGSFSEKGLGEIFVLVSLDVQAGASLHRKLRPFQVKLSVL